MAEAVEGEERPVIRVERTGDVAEVILDRAEKRNAMGPAFWEQCPRVFDALSQDDTVRVVLLRAEGETFSAGLDLPAFAALAPEIFGGTAKKRTRLLAEIERMQASITAVERCAKPVVAAIHGACVGGGLDLVAAACIRVASADARFSLREAKVGIVADLGSLQRLPRVIGMAATLEMAYTAADVSAERALRLGLVSEVYADREALLAGARQIARQIADNPPLVVQGIKAVVHETHGLSVADGLRRVAVWNAAFLESEDLHEAMVAFFERRAPAFEGR